MKAKIYVRVSKSTENNYITIQDTAYETQINERYQKLKDIEKTFKSNGKIETFKGFKLSYILIDIKYDGRQQTVTEGDIFNSMEQQGLVIKIGDNVFGGYHTATEKLNLLLQDQYNERKKMVDSGLYVTI